MNMVAVVLPVALASANPAATIGNIHRGMAIMTRVGQSFCAGRIDLQRYFRAALGSDDGATPRNGEACSQFQQQRHAIVVRTLPDLGLVKLKVSIEHGTITGWTTNAGMKVP